MILPWIGSTVVGHLFGQVLGDPRRFGIDFLLAAFFAVMAVGFFRAARSIAPLVVAIAVAIVVQKLVAGHGICSPARSPAVSRGRCVS